MAPRHGYETALTAARRLDVPATALLEAAWRRDRAAGRTARPWTRPRAEWGELVAGRPPVAELPPRLVEWVRSWRDASLRRDAPLPAGWNAYEDTDGVHVATPRGHLPAAPDVGFVYALDEFAECSAADPPAVLPPRIMAPSDPGRPAVVRGQPALGELHPAVAQYVCARYGVAPMPSVMPAGWRVAWKGDMIRAAWVYRELPTGELASFVGTYAKDEAVVHAAGVMAARRAEFTRLADAVGTLQSSGLASAEPAATYADSLDAPCAAWRLTEDELTRVRCMYGHRADRVPHVVERLVDEIRALRGALRRVADGDELAACAVALDALEASR